MGSKKIRILINGTPQSRIESYRSFGYYSIFKPDLLGNARQQLLILNERSQCTRFCAFHFGSHL